MTVKVNDGTDSNKASVVIQGAFRGNPVVITSNAHGLTNGTQVRIAQVKGMTQLNNNTYTIANVTSDTFELQGVNGTGFGLYTSGGVVIPVINGTGDYSQYKIHYTPFGTVEYLRDKFIDDGSTSSTDDHTTLNGAITVASNTITVANATKIPTPKQIVNEVDNTVTQKPGVIWIGTERIEYSTVTGNVLSDIIRGTRGTTVQDHSNSAEVYSGNTHIPNAKSKGFWNDNAVTLLDSSSEQANYLTNNENLIDYMQDTYVASDYVE